MRNQTRTYVYRGKEFDILPIRYDRLIVSDGYNSVRIRSNFRDRSGASAVVYLEDEYGVVWSGMEAFLKFNPPNDMGANLSVQEAVNCACTILCAMPDAEIYHIDLHQLVERLPIKEEV